MALLHAWTLLTAALLPYQAKERLPPGIELVKADDFQEWQVDIRVLDDNPLYRDQTYRLVFKFTENYPIRTSGLPLFAVSSSLCVQLR
jgi:ubiquitin-protein ligase